MGSKVRAAAVFAVTSALLAAGAAVVTAAPAAASTITEIAAGSWAYVDSTAPRTSFTDPAGDVPVGAHTYANGVTHVSKSYVTFDLSALRGTRLEGAGVSVDETTVADCSAPRTTELWLTDPAKKPTWNNQPAELVEAGGPIIDTSCPARGVFWNATTALQNALDAGRKTATFALRLPDAQQSDPKSGRAYNPHATLSISYNRAPLKPVQLTVDTTHACAAKPVIVGGGSTNLGAVITDPDGDFGKAEWALWPVDHPEQRVTIQNSFSSGGNASMDVRSRLADATTYAWQVRGLDGPDAGPWSAVCKLTTDFVPPDKPPVVSSKDYYEVGLGTGGTGVPGSFTFTANGVPDVVGYYYGLFDSSRDYVAATHKGGPATVTVVPDSSGPQYLSVWSVDAAGTWSDRTDYRFWVAANGPSMTCAPAHAYLGETQHCTFAPHGADGASGYVYSIDGGPEITAPAGSDHTATIDVTPSDATKPYYVTVRARMGNGNLSGPGGGQLPIDRGLPVVDVPADTMVGKPVVFTLHAILPGSVTFTYDWDYGDPVTVPVGPDGTARVTIVPGSAYGHYLDVHTTTADGIQSATREAEVQIASNEPTATSAEYPEGRQGGYVTTPGTFRFSSSVPGVVSYTYTYGGSAVTVPEGPDSTASAVLTPLTTDTQYLEVTSTFADGTVSETAYYSFYPRSAAPPLTCDANGGAQPGQVVHCTVTPVQPGLASYGYSVRTWSTTGPEVAVQPAADGTGVFEFTAPALQERELLSVTVWSADAAGQRSDTSYTSFYVTPDPASLPRAVRAS
ncbi:DNRLRE domain-containing protein [Amycolatopsis sp. cmx-8-4]|uniref:DNRLRE domain-containing protein n=1 Tax=Amycolatopsis sp. cmx-8-4 TaxID=2790947 RepID=UPI00397BEAF4